jgi:hypothetical protein
VLFLLARCISSLSQEPEQQLEQKSAQEPEKDSLCVSLLPEDWFSKRPIFFTITTKARAAWPIPAAKLGAS